MALNPINVKLDNSNNRTPRKDVAFQGAGDAVITIMDSIGRGGYIAEFFAQDGTGFVAPRILTGLNRNREETGEYNWKFAATEAIRELTSGPCFYVIPLIMLMFTKKYFGTANDVPIKFIKEIGEDFAQFASKQNASTLADKDILKKAYYKDAMKNILDNATENKLSARELENKADDFTKKILEIEKAPKKNGWKKLLGKRVEGSDYDLLCDLTDEFASLRKQYGGSLKEALNLEFSTVAKDKNGKPIKTEVNFQKFLGHLGNYTEDVAKRVSSDFKAGSSAVAEFVNKFNHKRISSRFMLILGMDIAVGAFLTIIPKMYKHKDGNPGLNGLPVEHDSIILNHPQEKEGR